MILEFELQGSRCLHKGIFDTHGIWIKYEPDIVKGPLKEDGTFEWDILGWKLYSHFSFAFFHEDKWVVDIVYIKMLGVLRGTTGAEMEGIGYIRKLSK